jgi:hypothetical protein
MNDAFKILIMHVDTLGVWRFSIFFGVFGMLCYFAKLFADTMGSLVGISWLYFTTSALCQVELPINRYGDLTSAFMQTGGQTFCELFVTTIFMLLLNSRGRLNFLTLFGVLIFIENVLVWWKGYGLMNQTSFDCALIASFLPFAPVYLLLPSLVTILFHHGSTALLIIGAQLIALTVREKGMRLLIVPCLLVLGLLARLHNIDFTFNGTERLETYVHFMRDWWSSGWVVRLFGSGSGSFMWISVVTSNFKPPLFLQLHSDWLQVLFENGIIGLGLATALFIVAVRRAGNFMLSLVLGFGAFALPYHPLRFFPSMILCAFIFSWVFEETQTLKKLGELK